MEIDALTLHPAHEESEVALFVLADVKAFGIRRSELDLVPSDTAELQHVLDDLGDLLVDPHAAVVRQRERLQVWAERESPNLPLAFGEDDLRLEDGAVERDVAIDDGPLLAQRTFHRGTVDFAEIGIDPQRVGLRIRLFVDEGEDLRRWVRKRV